MNKNYNILIIGGGAAGMLSAIIAKRKNPKLAVVIVDQNYSLGRKVLVTGAGRCNITNARLMKTFPEKYFSSSSELVKSVFTQFGLTEMQKFFTDLGVPLVEETKTNLGKIFPISDQAKSVVLMLTEELEHLKVDLLLGTKVMAVNKTGKNFSVDVESEEGAQLLTSDNVVLASGGCSYGRLGADASGYDLAEALGHSIIQPIPSTVPLESRNFLSANIDGVKMFVGAQLFDGKKKLQEREGDLLFTKYGVSGSVVLSLSRAASVLLNRENKESCLLKVNFLQAYPTFEKELTRLTKLRGYMTIENFMSGYFPAKFSDVFLFGLKLKADLAIEKLTAVQKKLLLDQLQNFEIIITGTRGFEDAEFTAGGVDAREVNVKTLESKKTKGLYLCGEVLDVDGDIGGYNLSWAWSSGAVVGNSL